MTHTVLFSEYYHSIKEKKKQFKFQSIRLTMDLYLQISNSLRLIY